MVSADNTAWSRNWPAPAKLNLTLEITGRRPDGYHELQTVFRLLDYADLLHFHRRDDGRIERLRGAAAVAADDDLVTKAAQALKPLAPMHCGVDIAVDKRLPLGGGIGGGSSNAATTLHALNILWQLNLPDDELAAIGLQLGADVPVFVHGHNAWAKGVGEQLQALELPEAWYLLAKPACQVSTAAVFGHPELTRNSPVRTIRAFLEQGGRNDCTAVVEKLHPEVHQALEIMGEVAQPRLTGTGACVFAEFASLAEAVAAQAVIGNRLTVLVARGVQRSALLQRVEQARSEV